VRWLTHGRVWTSGSWRSDAAGPPARHERPHPSHGDGLVPHRTISASTEGPSTWSPGLVDALWLAFTAHTALAPPEVPVLSRRAQGLRLRPSLLSISVIVCMAARAVHVLHQSAAVGTRRPAGDETSDGGRTSAGSGALAAGRGSPRGLVGGFAPADAVRSAPGE
jgi:hypothetical protein